MSLLIFAIDAALGKLLLGLYFAAFLFSFSAKQSYCISPNNIAPFPQGPNATIVIYDGQFRK